MFNFINLLLNVKYKWWYENDPIDENGPFYYKNDVVPNLEYIKENGINCAGFINLVARHLKTELPILNGGTDGWFDKMRSEDKLSVININKAYPRGTLLLRDYTDVDNQGHVAIKWDDKPLKDSQIVHAYSKNCMNRELNEPGVSIEDFNISNNWYDNGTYTHVATHWFLK